MDAKWYVLHSKSCKELFLARELAARNFETYLPVLYVKPVNPRAHKIKPYFPGYLFVRINPQSTNLSSFSWIPGVSGFVSFGGEPSFIPDELIYAIRKKVDKINTVGEVLAGLQSGDRVLVEDGPFAGYQGIFDSQLPGDNRVRILLDLLKNRQMRLDLPVSLVKRIKTSF